MPKTTIPIAGATALTILAIAPGGAGAAGADHAAPPGELRVAQLAPESSPPRRVVRPRIEVTPGRLFYRECVDGYREVWRPYWGTTVVMPYMHCRWVRG